jgi:predicted outer membrane protein
VQAQASAELSDHRGLSAQLSFAGRRLNLLPPGGMLNSDSERLALLAGSADFDAAYKQQMIAAHQYHLKLSRDVAARGLSPTLRPVARNAALVLARHLDRLSAL